MEEIVWGAIAIFLFKLGSRNRINNKRREEPFVEHYERTFGLRLAHQDTNAEVLRKLDSDALEQVKMDLMSHMFDQKWLRPYRLLNKYYPVAIDATGVVSFAHKHCEHCLTKTSKNGKVTYYLYVLEAKLVTRDGHCLSLATEWIENPGVDYEKQDCERKAFLRLATKLKKQYPRLPICILGDGLYPYQGAFKICENNDWKYIYVLQEESLKTVHEELVLTKRRKPARENHYLKDGYWIDSRYRFQTNILYHEKYNLHWFQCLETRTKQVKPGKVSTGKPEEFCFEYVTNIEPSAENIIEVSGAGRLRWKIENEGFNDQKCGDYELEHKYCRTSYEGLKNYYTCLQIAHAINQLLEQTREVTEMLKEHSKETIRNIWENLIAYMVMVVPLKETAMNPHPS
jgi:hypothetical protein